MELVSISAWDNCYTKAHNPLFISFKQLFIDSLRSTPTKVFNGSIVNEKVFLFNGRIGRHEGQDQSWMI